MKESELVAALKKHDPAGVKLMVRLYADRLIRSAFLLCSNETDAQDLLQQTLVEAVISVHRFRGDSPLYTWLHGILLNLSRSYHRKRKRMPFTYRFPTGKLTSSPDALYEKLDRDTSELGQNLEKLSPSYREVVVLRFYEGMKLKEIAQLLGLPSSTVRNRLRRALKQLRRSMKIDATFWDKNDTHR